jgi:hypothetical protein
MDILNLDGSPPERAIAVLSRATYFVAGVPHVPGSLRWSLSGDTSPLRIEGGDAPDRVTLLSLHRSEQAGASTLTITFIPADDSPPISADLALTVWAAHIADAGGAGVPTSIVGVGNFAHYRAVTLPALDGIAPTPQPTWRPAGHGGIAIASLDAENKVAVLGQTATPDGVDALLQLTLTLGSQQAGATQPITVFDVDIDLFSEGESGLLPAGAYAGVGETRVVQARVRPASVLQGSPPTTWTWTAGSGVQWLGGTCSTHSSWVAAAPCSDSPVAVTLTIDGSTVRAQRQVTVFGVRIVGADGGTPSHALPAGGKVVLRALLDPPLSSARYFWSASEAISLASADDQAVVTGAQPSTHEGADAVGINVMFDNALAHALAPITVYSTIITSPDGGPAVPQVPVNSRQRYAVNTHPALSDMAVSWAVQGNAALTGSTTHTQIELVTLAQSDYDGDILLGVSVVPPDMPHSVPNATLAITAGSPRKYPPKGP